VINEHFESDFNEIMVKKRPPRNVRSHKANNMIHPILFNSLAFLLILFIIVWFWLIKDQSTKVKANEMTVFVKDGVYSPHRIETSQSKLVLKFIRQDASPCSEYVLFDQLGIHEQLPLNKPYRITLNDLKPGHYRFTCQMGMYQGELIVNERNHEQH